VGVEYGWAEKKTWKLRCASEGNFSGGTGLSQSKLDTTVGGACLSAVVTGAKLCQMEFPFHVRNEAVWDWQAMPFTRSGYMQKVSPDRGKSKCLEEQIIVEVFGGSLWSYMLGKR